MSTTSGLVRAGYRAALATYPDVEVDIYYAADDLASAVVRLMRDEGLSLDVCTGGELACALRAGMPPERILFHGNNKSVDELEAALAAGVGRIVVTTARVTDSRPWPRRSAPRHAS